MQLRQLREFLERHRWQEVLVVEEVASGSRRRPERDRLLDAARRREIDIIAVWRLDRWGRSLSDLMLTLRELQELDVAFVSLTEAFDLTTSTGRAMAAMVAVFAEFEREIRSERVRAGIEQARHEGRQHGRPRSASLQADEVRRLASEGLSKPEIARRLSIGPHLRPSDPARRVMSPLFPGDPSDEELARVSPLVHRHIIPSGTYRFRDQRARLE